MPRKGHPDYAVDPDRGSSASPTKNARLVDLDEHQDRAASRSGLRDLDAMTEGMSGLTRMQKDRERLFPRGTTADLGDRYVIEPAFMEYTREMFSKSYPLASDGFSYASDTNDEWLSGEGLIALLNDGPPTERRRRATD